MPFEIKREKQGSREIVIGGPKVQPPPVVNKQGRKQMADVKLNDETGVKKISEQPADKQGPVGTGAQSPARPAQPESDVKIGGKEERENG